MTQLSTNTLWTPQETARFLGISDRTLRTMRSKDEGPAYVTIGTSTIRYWPGRVQQWVQQNTTETSESKPASSAPRNS